MKLTVFTPTYNRKELLERVYESLKKQTCNDFEWVIVDDGSNDGTKEAVEAYLSREHAFEIRYYYQENGGKMRAHNRGVEYAKGELFVCLDSDDYFVNDAVEKLLKAWDEALEQSDNPQRLAGIVSHKGKSESELLGATDFPHLGEDTLFGLYTKGFRGETTLMFLTRVLKEFPFPEIEGEKYVPEDYIYDKIDKIYTLYILPSIITVCEVVSEGYTDSVRKLKFNNVNAWYLYYEQRAYITKPSILKFKYAGFYVIYAHRAQKRIFKGARIPFIWIIAGHVAALALKITGKE